MYINKEELHEIYILFAAVERSNYWESVSLDNLSNALVTTQNSIAGVNPVQNLGVGFTSENPILYTTCKGGSKGIGRVTSHPPFSANT